MPEIDCITLFGEIKRIPAEQVSLRPAAYGMLVADGKLLLMTMKLTGKYHLPGGGLEVGERLEETLAREMREETGLEVEVGRLAHFAKFFFYYDPSGRAYHGLNFYYLCQPKTTALIPDEQVEDGAAGQPRWVEIGGLRAEDFQSHGEVTLRLAREAAVKQV